MSVQKRKKMGKKNKTNSSLNSPRIEEGKGFSSLFLQQVKTESQVTAQVLSKDLEVYSLIPALLIPKSILKMF